MKCVHPQKRSTAFEFSMKGKRSHRTTFTYELIPSLDLDSSKRITYLKFTNELSLHHGEEGQPLLLACIAVLPDQIDYDRCTGRLYVFRLRLENGVVSSLQMERKYEYSTPVTTCDVMTDPEKYVVLSRMIDNIPSSGSRIIMVDLEKKSEEEMPKQQEICSYVTSIHCIYNMIVVGDILRGLTFLMWKVGIVDFDFDFDFSFLTYLPTTL